MPLEKEKGFVRKRTRNDLEGESIPNSSEEQEVGMVGLRMQDMAGKVRRESRVGSKVKAAVGSKVAGEDSGGGV